MVISVYNVAHIKPTVKYYINQKKEKNHGTIGSRQKKKCLNHHSINIKTTINCFIHTVSLNYYLGERGERYA